MDGNGRWARQKGLPRLEGHRRGVETVDRIVTYACELGISYLTLYAFSVENWARPESEVQGLMVLLQEFLKLNTPKLLNHNIRLRAIGHLEKLPESARSVLHETMEKTAKGTQMTLTLALSYGGRDEIVRAFQRMSQVMEPDQIVEEKVKGFLDTSFLPDPDLVLRTSGEHRLSNFLLWQAAYAEFIFVETLWPDFSELDFDAAILEYQRRERRFGKTSEQWEQD